MRIDNRNLPALWSSRFDFDRLLDGLFEDFAGGSTGSASFLPVTDIEEDEKSYVLKVEIPGMSQKDVTVEVKENVLTISGEKKFESESKAKHRIERYYGSFSRSFVLPEDANAQKADAACKDGVLTISIPKVESKESKAIRLDIK